MIIICTAPTNDIDHMINNDNNNRSINHTTSHNDDTNGDNNDNAASHEGYRCLWKKKTTLYSAVQLSTSFMFCLKCARVATFY